MTKERDGGSRAGTSVTRRAARRLVIGLLVTAALTIALAPSASPITDTDADDAAADLLAFVPASHRYTCGVANPSDAHDVGQVLADRHADIAAMVECTPSDKGVSYVAYVQFTSADAMSAAYHDFAPSAGEEPIRDAAADCPSESGWQFGSTDAGRVACYYSSADGVGNPISERAALAWTYDDELILALANGPSSEAEELTTWWNDEAGPLQGPAQVPGIVTGSASRRSAQALRGHVPATFRASCRALDVSDPEQASDFSYRSRLFLGAAFRCTPKKGADQATFYSVDPAVIDGYFAQYTEVNDVGDDNSSCPGSGTWSTGSGSKGKDVGEYACWIADDGAAVIAWTHRRFGILATAYRGDGDGGALHAFWTRGLGPV